MGGLWHYDANPNVPSVYASLTAATTTVEMALPGSPFECRDTHPGHVAVMGYLQEFATRHKIKPCIRYRSDVTMLERRDGRWVLTVVDLDINVPMEVVADAVAVCVGHHSVARTLSDKDIPGLSSFTGRQMHSSQYRTPASVYGKAPFVHPNPPYSLTHSLFFQLAAKCSRGGHGHVWHGNC